MGHGGVQVLGLDHAPACHMATGFDRVTATDYSTYVVEPWFSSGPTLVSAPEPSSWGTALLLHPNGAWAADPPSKRRRALPSSAVSLPAFPEDGSMPEA